MKTLVAATGALLAALWISASGHGGGLLAALWISAPGHAGETPLQSASIAWDRGDYVTALTIYLQVLDSPQAEEALEPIALQTGELYHSIELTADGAAPAFSPDGRFILYETGVGPARITRVLPSDGSTKPVSELPGFGAVFSPDGSKLAYLSAAHRQELTEAQAVVDRAPRSSAPRSSPRGLPPRRPTVSRSRPRSTRRSPHSRASSSATWPPGARRRSTRASSGRPRSHTAPGQCFSQAPTAARRKSTRSPKGAHPSCVRPATSTKSCSR